MDSADSENAKRAFSPLVARSSALTKDFSASLVQLFTLPPTQRGGRRARKGYEFQDYWIAYKLVSSLSDSDDLVSARIEGVEDLDLFVRREESFVEQYIQIKSKEEGAGNWTIASLEKENVFSRFFRLFEHFQKASPDEERKIEFVVVVEGDLSKPVQQIQQSGGKELFPILVVSQIRAISTAYEPEAGRIQDFLERSAPELFNGASAKDKIDWRRFAAEIARRISLGSAEIEQTLSEVALSTAKELKEFTRILKFHSRAPGVTSLRDVAITRIMQSADVAVADANKAFEKLLSEIADESSKASPTQVDRSLLISWLGLAPKPSLRVKPELVPDYIHRSEFAQTFSGIFNVETFVVLYGLSKIGKSQFASRYIELSTFKQR